MPWRDFSRACRHGGKPKRAANSCGARATKTQFLRGCDARFGMAWRLNRYHPALILRLFGLANGPPGRLNPVATPDSGTAPSLLAKNPSLNAHDP
jgi:hypothetical protein